MAKQLNEPKTEAATFRFAPERLRKLKYIALMDETTQTEIIDRVLADFIEKWEKKNGEIPVKK